jgi:hypothetical protein
MSSRLCVNGTVVAIAATLVITIAIGFARAHLRDWGTSVAEGGDLAASASFYDIPQRALSSLTAYGLGHPDEWAAVTVFAVTVDATLILVFLASAILSIRTSVPPLVATLLALALSAATAIPPPGAGELCTLALYRAATYVDPVSAFRGAVCARIFGKIPRATISLRASLFCVLWFVTCLSIASGCVYSAAAFVGLAVGVCCAQCRFGDR